MKSITNLKTEAPGWGFVLPFILCLCLIQGTTLNVMAQVSCYKSVGYFPSWQGNASAIDYGKFTHINYSFGIPNANGTINAVENSAKLVDLVSRAHQNDVKVLLAVGGWLSSSPSSTPFESISTNSSAINQFVNSCMSLVNQYNLDGIDIDWEYPTSQTRWNSVINPLSSSLHGAGKLLTAAVPASGYYGGGIGNTSGLDLVNIMSYDCACPSNAPYSQAVDALNYWSGRGVPQGKRMLGFPFYSSDNNTSLHVQKANLAKANAGGIMVWEISTYGDITAIYNTLGGLCTGGSNPPSSNYSAIPGRICATAYSSMGGIQSESTNDGSCAQNIGWIDSGDWMTYNINVATSGNYTVRYRVASQNGGGSIRLERAGGGLVYGTISVPSTGGWQSWTTISNSVQLTAGQQQLGLAVPSGGYNINWIEFVGQTGGGPTQFIQAEAYSNMSGVQKETTSDTGGGQNVGWIDAGDWMSFDGVNIPSTGSYVIGYRVASQNGGGSLRLEKAGGGTIYGTTSIPSTGGWQTWTTVYQTVNLTAGIQSFGIAIPAGGWNINWWSITPNTGSREVSEDLLDLGDNIKLSAYPNPFTQEVKIPVRTKLNFELQIYDISGALFRNFRREDLNHDGDIVWNGKNAQGTEAARGIYFYKLVSENGILKGKLLKN